MVLKLVKKANFQSLLPNKKKKKKHYVRDLILEEVLVKHLLKVSISLEMQQFLFLIKLKFMPLVDAILEIPMLMLLHETIHLQELLLQFILMGLHLELLLTLLTTHMLLVLELKLQVDGKLILVIRMVKIFFTITLKEL